MHANEQHGIIAKASASSLGFITQEVLHLCTADVALGTEGGGVPNAANVTPVDTPTNDKAAMAAGGDDMSARYPRAIGDTTKPMSPHDLKSAVERPLRSGGARSAA